jgi:hypothetical protein
MAGGPVHNNDGLTGAVRAGALARDAATTTPATLKLRFGLAAIFAALTLAGCSESSEWNQKVTVEIETPGGLKSSSSVTGMKYTYVPGWQRGLSATANVFELKGEAVVLEISAGRYLFALTPRETYLGLRVLHKQFGLEAGDERNLAPRIAAFRGTVALDPKDYPLLVTFAEIDDPKTVTKVDPIDLTAAFGTGVSLKGITLEITDEKVTGGKVEHVLNWLGTIGGEMLDGQRISIFSAENRLANDLSRLDFKRE